MTTHVKIVLGLTMSLALAFGFLHLFVPDFHLDFDRLHIFLFNLCAGGSVLLYFARGERRFSPSILAYFALTLAYAVSAFLEVYAATLVLSVPIFALVESTRVRRFGFFPLDFFRPVPTQSKFLQAALLCLSLGIVIASFVILNNEYLQLFTLEKLSLRVFFLGYSFPISLLTFSVIYSYMKPPASRLDSFLRELSFWSITVGVVTFFVFIIFELRVAEIIISNALLAAVTMTFVIFARSTPDVQQKTVLSSGMAFLIVTGLTGVFYLFDSFVPVSEASYKFVLLVHATVALYGWNLSGIFIIVRMDDFPLFKRPMFIVLLHWLSVFVLTPIGKYYGVMSLIALVAYVALVGLFFFSRSLKSGGIR